MNRGLMLGCLLTVVVFVTSALGVLWYLRAGSPATPGQVWAALGAGLCVAAAAFYLIMIREAVRYRRTLRSADSEAAPTDGKWGVFTGTIESPFSVKAPMSGEDVVGYRYSVSYSRSGSDMVSNYYQGGAFVPSTIVTSKGSYPILAFPIFSLEDEALPQESALQRFLAYIETASFPRPYQPGRPEPLWNADDPSTHRFDHKIWDGDPDWPKANLSEQILHPGDSVTVLGTYRAGQGIVADPSAEPPEIRGGGVDGAFEAAAEQVRQGITGAIFFSVAAVAVVWGYRFFAS